MERYDVVIVGAGPSGCSAAEKLAQNGIGVLLLEKEKLPRNKLCAGVLPERINHLLGEIPSDIVERNFIGYRLHSPKGLVVESKFHRPGFIVSRKKFDGWMVEKARNAGVELIDGVKVIDVMEEENKVLVQTGIHSFPSKFLISADGSTSSIRKRVGLDGPRKEDLAIALQVDVSLSEDDIIARMESWFDVYYPGIIDEGYGWISAHKDHIKVGVGSTSSRFKKDPKSFFKKFLEEPEVKQKIEGGIISSIKSHVIPLSGPLPNLATKRTLLVGDAAGFVWPLTGEGIYEAVHSGQVAAETIGKMLSDPEGGLPSLYNGLLEKQGLLRLRRSVNDRDILKDAKSKEEYIQSLRKKTKRE
ncbi:MAG: NAD(P)/FAD-dependent oxidoreductase [Candidatus Altiarchaeota archaeon]